MKSTYDALSPGYDEATVVTEGRLSAYRADVVSDTQLAEIDPTDYIMVVLANVASLPRRWTGDLFSYVREGGALMVFLGKNVDPIVYNREFYQEGQGPLPLRMGDLRGDAKTSFHLVHRRGRLATFARTTMI